MNAVIAVIGKDNVGILASVSNVCADYSANIVEVSQTILQEYFTMVMVATIDKLIIPLDVFVDKMKEKGREIGVEIYVMHEDIFNSMHKI